MWIGRSSLWERAAAANPTRTTRNAGTFNAPKTIGPNPSVNGVAQSARAFGGERLTRLVFLPGHPEEHKRRGAHPGADEKDGPVAEPAGEEAEAKVADRGADAVGVRVQVCRRSRLVRDVVLKEGDRDAGKDGDHRRAQDLDGVYLPGGAHLGQ